MKPRSLNSRSTIAAINKAGVLLVFPLDNRPEPASIWSFFYPKEDMVWEWDEDGDDRVAQLWHLRAELSTTRKVVYTKWFRGRATYLSRELFTALLRALNPTWGERESLSREARDILRVLDGDSPLSTKEIKRQVGLKGKQQEGAYTRALKELWDRLLIVAYGEVDDGAFPSLAIGATQVIYEDLWTEASRLSPEEADRFVTKALRETLFLKHYLKLKAARPTQSKTRAKKGDTDKDSPKPKIPSVVRFKDL